jgi:hypothetical protein
MSVNVVATKANQKDAAFTLDDSSGGTAHAKILKIQYSCLSDRQASDTNFIIITIDGYWQCYTTSG